MKFKNYLTEIDNVAIFPIISLVIFTSVFLIAAIYALTRDASKMDKNAQIPMD